MLDEPVLDRIGTLLSGLRVHTLAARLAVAIDVARLLEDAGTDWSELVTLLKAGAYVSRDSDPELLKWAFGDQWEALPVGPDGLRQYRYTDPIWGTWAQVEECRGPCSCFGGLAREHQLSRWRACDDVGKGDPLVPGAPGSMCHPGRMEAQLAVRAVIDAWGGWDELARIESEIEDGGAAIDPLAEQAPTGPVDPTNP
jgi:hypothetical protein